MAFKKNKIKEALGDLKNKNLSDDSLRPAQKSVVVSEGSADGTVNFNAIDHDAGGEAVKDTLDRIKSEKAEKAVGKKKPYQTALKVISIIFFPITLIVFGMRALFKRFKVGIAVKTTVIFSLMFGVMIVIYAAFTIASIGNFVGSNGQVTREYFIRLIITVSRIHISEPTSA